MLSDTPIRDWYLRAAAGATQGGGGWGELDAGAHPWGPLGFYGFGRLESELGWAVGLGAEVRGTF